MDRKKHIVKISKLEFDSEELWFECCKILKLYFSCTNARKHGRINYILREDKIISSELKNLHGLLANGLTTEEGNRKKLMMKQLEKRMARVIRNSAIHYVLNFFSN